MVELITADEAARFLGVNRGMVYRMARQGLLPNVRFGRILRFEKAALVKWVQDGGQALPGGWRMEPKALPRWL